METVPRDGSLQFQRTGPCAMNLSSHVIRADRLSGRKDAEDHLRSHEEHQCRLAPILGSMLATASSYLDTDVHPTRQEQQLQGMGLSEVMEVL